MPAPLPLEIRALIAERLNDGEAHSSIAEDLGVSRSAVTKLSGHINCHGHFYPIKPPGLPATLNNRDLEKVKQIINENPNGTIAFFAEAIAKRTRKRKLSKSTIHRVLTGLGFSFKKVTKVASEQERPDVKKK